LEATCLFLDLALAKQQADAQILLPLSLVACSNPLTSEFPNHQLAMSSHTHSGIGSGRCRPIVLDSSEGSDTELLGIGDDSDINLSGFDEVSSSSDGRVSSYMSNTVTQVSASSSTDGLDLFDSESV
jgi:hypothetical protein